MELLKQPSLIHPAYNPVVFTFKGTPYTTETIYIVAGDENIPLEIDFDENEIGEVEISGILKSLFRELVEPSVEIQLINSEKTAIAVVNTLEKLNTSFNFAIMLNDSEQEEYIIEGIIPAGSNSVETKEVTSENKFLKNSWKWIFQNDNFQSFNYRIKDDLSDLAKPLGTYTAVRSASQIREVQNLTQLKSKLLTGFDKLYAIEGYPADVSILGDSITHKGLPLIKDRINRLPYDCSDRIMPVSPECSFEWSDSVCQIKNIGEFIPISTIDDLISINSIPNIDNLPYVLINDLDFTDFKDENGNTKMWVPIQNFNGVFYGQGYAIKNFNPTFQADITTGIFGSFYGHIQDVNLENINIYQYRHYGTGSLIGILGTDASIDNCHIKNSVIDGGSKSYNDTGGLIGTLLGTANNCSARNVTVNGLFGVGALFGSISANVEGKGIATDCFASGTVNVMPGGFYGGGIAGRIGLRDATVQRCIASCTINFTGGARYGGGVGESYSRNSENIKMLECVMIQGSKIVTSYPDDVGRIGSLSTNHLIRNCYSIDSFDIGREAISNNSGRDGETVNIEQTQLQAFYESLSYDFNGSTQPGNKPVWGMGEDGYPTIIKPFIKFMVKCEETGNALSLILKYKNNRTTDEKTYNILDPINSLYPAITVEQYKLYTNEQAQDRARALLDKVKINCSDYIINNDVVIINGFCPEEVSFIAIDGHLNKTIEFSGCDPIEKQIMVESSGLWSIENTPSWLVISPDSGSSGITTVSVKPTGVAPDERSAELKFKVNDNKEAVLEVSQNVCQPTIAMLTLRLNADKADVYINGIFYSYTSDFNIDVDIDGYPATIHIDNPSIYLNNGEGQLGALKLHYYSNNIVPEVTARRIVLNVEQPGFTFAELEIIDPEMSPL